MWQTSSRAACLLNLVSAYRLIRPFASSKLVPFPQVKYLHDDAVAKSGSEEDSSAVDQPKLEARSDTLDAKSTKEEPDSARDEGAATPRYAPGYHPNSVATREKLHKEQRVLGWPIFEKRNEEQRALGWPTLKAAREKSLEKQRAAGFPMFEKRNEEQRALGWPTLKAASEKSLEKQRAAGFPNLREARETQRAEGFTHLKANHAKLRASDWRQLREVYRINLLRDIEAANERKLAADPNFKPLPIPDLMSKPRRETSRVGNIPCPEPGCKRMLKHEKSLKEHMRRYHGGYSKETPHKCEFASCNQYYATEAKAQKHFQTTHLREKARCTWCDRKFNASNMARHLYYVHGQPMDTVPKY
jgi:hypothetical protein